MRLYSEIELNEQLDRLNLSPKQKSNIRGLISIITEKYSDQIEKMKCCGNCIHQYERKIEDGVRCKDHYSDSVCSHWKYDEQTVEVRLNNEWS